MENYIILSDVTCDLSEEIRTRFNIEDYITGHVQFSDGRDFKTTLDWSNISHDDFYKTLSNKKIEINTAPGSPEEYYVMFKKYAEQGYKILSMSISSKISSTYNVALNAAKRVMSEVPNSEIYAFDSLRMSGALGLLVINAHILKNEGKSFNEVIEWLESNKNKVHQMGPIDDLIYVARRGRITMGKAIMGNFAGVKPMGDCTHDGYVSVMTKVKGINKALDLTAKYFDKVVVNPKEQVVLISHSNRLEYAQKLREIILSNTEVKDILISDVFSGCAPNIGPGMVGIYFLGNEISEDLALEKEILNELVNRWLYAKQNRWCLF